MSTREACSSRQKGPHTHGWMRVIAWFSKDTYELVRLRRRQEVGKARRLKSGPARPHQSW